MHRLLAVEMVLLASGLAALRLKPRDLLQPLARAAVEKLETFGAVELSTLLGSLTTLRHHDLSLLRASAARLPEVRCRPPAEPPADPPSSPADPPADSPPPLASLWPQYKPLTPNP